jgi:endoglucanase
MKKLCLIAALLLLASSCTPGSTDTPEPSERVWEGRGTPVPPTPSPIPTPIGFDTLPVPEIAGEFTVPDTESMRFAAAMSPGWNLGNTLDATGERGVMTEVSWGNPFTTQAMISLLKDSGFKTLRLPVTWHNQVDDDFNINAAWMDRVQEVVDYAYGIGMKVIINIHHDDDVRFVYPSAEHYANSARYVKRIWEQISERFIDYSDRLIFESLNEPRLKGNRFEWWQDWNNDECIEALDTLCSLHQVFVDTVRASGGNNAARYLMVCGLGANADSVMTDLYRMPQDTAEDRILISVHAYTPFHFALSSPDSDRTTSRFDMSSLSSTNEINQFMDRLYSKYIYNGIPVVLGEFGARDKGGNLRDRAEFAAYYTASAAARGMPCFWWDNGIFSGGGTTEIFGLMDRRGAQWYYPDIVDALIAYSEIKIG